MNKLVETFCDIDNFYKVYQPEWRKILIKNGGIKRRRTKWMDGWMDDRCLNNYYFDMLSSITLSRLQKLLFRICFQIFKIAFPFITKLYKVYRGYAVRYCSSK